MSKKSNIAVLGAGFAGLSAATVLAHNGVETTVFEKNADPGGRCRKFTKEGFLFDMGPSWYWMPDVMERFFNKMDKSIYDYMNLIKLDPGFRIFYGAQDYIDIPNTLEEQMELFESLESGSGSKLKKFLEQSKIKYDIGVSDLIYKPSYSLLEFASPKVIFNMIKMNALSSFHSYIRKSFKHPRLLALLEFPILFLGGTAKTTPSLYSLMNYSCLVQGTYYPMGGFHNMSDAFYQLAKEKGVNFEFESPIERLKIENKKVSQVKNGTFHHTDGVISSLDYQFLEEKILGDKYANYSNDYWDKQTLSPSALIFYIGVKGKVDNLIHHNLFFDEDFDVHAEQIYKNPEWPDAPLFYVCCPSKTDPDVAPQGDENIFILMPLAPGIEDNESIRETYFNKIITRLEKNINDKIQDRIVVKESYCISDFERDYNSYKGNAYGLANTLMQTAMFKPSMKHKKIKNLFSCGQLTVPGPGVPPSIISGHLAASQMLSYLNQTTYEKYI